MKLLGKHKLRLSFIAYGILLAVLVLATLAEPARAFDIWLVTDQNRILVIRDVETSPHQEYVITHDDVPDAHTIYGYFGFGDFAFAPSGKLYGISMTLEQKSHLYTIDLNTGHITQLHPEMPFEWGNALEFGLRTGIGYTGGGLESYQPYRYLKGFYAFYNEDPSTVTLWHDMRSDYPQGGYTGGYAEANGYLYAIWGQGNWNGHKTYLLQITTDNAGNFLSYKNLGDAESQGIAEGIWGLSSDGAHLYAISGHSLYRVNIDENSVAHYQKIFDFQLNPNEDVNGTTSEIADLSISLSANETSPTVGEPFEITVTVHNAGPHDADETTTQVIVPADFTLESSSTSSGTFDPATGIWDIGTVIANQEATLTLTVRPQHAGSSTVQAQVTRTGPIDPDSVASVGFDKDDWQDGQSDDDETSLPLNITNPPTPTPTPTPTPNPLPNTGFPRDKALNLPPSAHKALIYLPITLEIPTLGINAPIVGVPQDANGEWDVRWLGNYIGWLQGTAFPTRSGNTVLVGHVWNADNTPGVFIRIKNLRFGDRIFIHAWGLSYEYEVRENTLLLPDDRKAVFKQETQDWITLLTCEGYIPATGDYRYRRMVRAVLVAIR